MTLRRCLLLVFFLGPALLVLGALVLYPIVFTVIRSLFDASGRAFVGLANYREMVAYPDTSIAIRNNILWALVAPSLVTGLGLVFAVLTERCRWRTAFRMVVFLPMAISFLSAGVIWRLVFELDPQLGLANAALRSLVSIVQPPGPYPGARPSRPPLLSDGHGGFLTRDRYAPGETAFLGLVGIAPHLVPRSAREAAVPGPVADAIRGVVWRDFPRGGGGRSGTIDPEEPGLPGITVEAVRDGKVVGSTRTREDGSFILSPLPREAYQLRLAANAFREPFGGILWLGPGLVTPSIIVAYGWMWVGFALVVIAAGLGSVPREALEAARVDGASEWQVFRRVTIPLLGPVLGVVFVTLLINVLKIFDLVLVIPPGSSQADANVVALEMWRVAFGGARDQGLGSALAVFLFLLVLPAMLVNLRRFRRSDR